MNSGAFSQIKAGTIEHSDVMGGLKERHHIIKELINGANVNYVDMPVYTNVGDLLIMLGTVKFFAESEINITVSATHANYNPGWLKSDEVLVFQGGGNFGDLYAGPQQIREKSIKRLVNNRIIILPQTINFESDDAYKACRAIMSRHDDLHICVRDERSYGIAKTMTPNVYLLPDMAHQLWPLKHPASLHSEGVLGLIRSDKECAGHTDERIYSRKTDWDVMIGLRRERAIRMFQRLLHWLHKLGAGPTVSNVAMKMWVRYAQTIANEAIALFCAHNEVITDRLHGHILACLLGMPNTVLDNSYGKNASYVKAWTGNSNIVKTQCAK